MVNYWNEDGGFDPDGGCIVRTGQTFVADTQERLDLMLSCKFEHESAVSFSVPEEVEGDEDGGTSTPEKPVSKVEKQVETKSVPAAAVEEAHTEAAETVAKAQAVVEQVPHVADLKSALPAAADTNMLTIVMAGIAVLGGGAAFKFYQNFSAQKHEQSMKKLELDQKRQEEQGKECKAHAGAALELSAIKSRLDEVEEALEETSKKLKEVDEKANKKGSVSFGDMDADELVEKLERVEKKVKKLDREIHDDGDKA